MTFSTTCTRACLQNPCRSAPRKRHSKQWTRVIYSALLLSTSKPSCKAVDNNVYLPVHTRTLSKPMLAYLSMLCTHACLFLVILQCAVQTLTGVRIQDRTIFGDPQIVKIDTPPLSSFFNPHLLCREQPVGFDSQQVPVQGMHARRDCYGTCGE